MNDRPKKPGSSSTEGTSNGKAGVIDRLKKYRIAIALVVVVIGAIVVASIGFTEIRLVALGAGDIAGLLGTVLFTALVIERAVEVYLNNGLPDLAKRNAVLVAEGRVAIAEAAVSEEAQRQGTAGVSPDPNALQMLREEAAETRRELGAKKKDSLEQLIRHRQDKARWACVVTTLLSLLAALAGIRILGQFLPLSEEGTLIGPLERNSWQLWLFRFGDTVLTTGVLAGGADGIHQIVRRFTKPSDPQ